MPRLSKDFAIASRKHLESVLTSYELPTPSTIINPASKGTPSTGKCEVQVIEADTINAALNSKDNKVAVLNFASFKNPGGGFIEGAIAQEEAICFCSNLYYELCRYKESWYAPHLKCLHNGMYENQSLLSKNISIVAFAPNRFLPKNECKQVDVLTCAAPNWTSALRYGSLPESTLQKATKDRIEYVMRILSDGDYDDVILGAFGCGVFKNDPVLVANAFRECLSTYAFKHLTFAIPDSSSTNFKVFNKILS